MVRKPDTPFTADTIQESPATTGPSLKIAKDEQGNPLRIEGTLSDINQRQLMEKQLQEKNQQLNESLSDLKRQHEILKTTQSRLVQAEKMAGLGTVVAGVAHEINNPTNYVYLSANTLEKDLNAFRKEVMDIISGSDEEIIHYFEDNFERFQRSLKNIQEGSNRIKTIVMDLRTFARMDESEKKESSLADALKLTIWLAKTQYNQEIEFITDFQTDRNIECYPAQINQVFLNIMVNSCQAILRKQRYGKDENRGRIIIRLYDNGKELVSIIEDNGCGMTEDEKTRVFEPFFTTKPVGEGSGLGMSISYGIIEKHHGRMEIETQAGIGTTISVYLPYSNETR